MKIAVTVGVAWLLVIALEPNSAAARPERPGMEDLPTQERFGPFVFQRPAGYTGAADRTERIPSRIPGAAPTIEHFRSYVGPQGRGLYLFHWKGPPQRDLGPMRAKQTWEITIDGQPAKISETELFFGAERRVLSAHFATPDGDVCLIYQATADPSHAPERGPFLALMSTIRFEPASVGVATMRIDGTILLQLRATGGAAALGDALVSYPPSHPQYREILDHLGGLKPGESKPVMAFPPGE